MARGWSAARTMTYPALCLVRPPFQLPFASAARSGSRYTSPTSVAWSVHKRKHSSIDTSDSEGGHSKAERHADTLGIDDTALRKWYRVPVTDSEKTTIGHNLGVGRSRVEMTKRTVIGSIVLVESHSRQRTLCHPFIQNGFRPSVIILTSAAIELLDKHRKDASSLRRFDNDRGRCREVGNDVAASGAE